MATARPRAAVVAPADGVLRVGPAGPYDALQNEVGPSGAEGGVSLEAPR